MSTYLGIVMKIVLLAVLVSPSTDRTLFSSKVV